MRSRSTPRDSPDSCRGAFPRPAVPPCRAHPVGRRRAGSVPPHGRRSPCVPPCRATTCHGHDALAWRLLDRSHWTRGGAAAATSDSTDATADQCGEPGLGVGPSTDRSRYAVAAERACDVAPVKPELRARGNRPTRHVESIRVLGHTASACGRGQRFDGPRRPAWPIFRPMPRPDLGLQAKGGASLQHGEPDSRGVRRAARR